MCYVIFNTETTILMDTRKYETERAAKAALTRAVNKGKVVREEMTVASFAEFNKVEKSVEKISLMNGEKYMERVNTPRHCSPASEAYWSA